MLLIDSAAVTHEPACATGTVSAPTPAPLLVLKPILMPDEKLMYAIEAVIIDEFAVSVSVKSGVPCVPYSCKENTCTDGPYITAGR